MTTSARVDGGITVPLPFHCCDHFDVLTDDGLCPECHHWADRPMPPLVVRAHRESAARARAPR